MNLRATGSSRKRMAESTEGVTGRKRDPPYFPAHFPFVARVISPLPGGNSSAAPFFHPTWTFWPTRMWISKKVQLLGPARLPELILWRTQGWQPQRESWKCLGKAWLRIKWLSLPNEERGLVSASGERVSYVRIRVLPLATRRVENVRVRIPHSLRSAELARVPTMAGC